MPPPIQLISLLYIYKQKYPTEFCQYFLFTFMYLFLIFRHYIRHLSFFVFPSIERTFDPTISTYRNGITFTAFK